METGLVDQFLHAESLGLARVLGRGFSRVAYVVDGLRDVVFKRLVCLGNYDNKREFAFWNAAPDDVRQHLAPLLDYDAARGVLAMARTNTDKITSEYKNWKHLSRFAWASDCHEHNVGLYDGRWVIHDYGHCKVENLTETRDGAKRAVPYPFVEFNPKQSRMAKWIIPKPSRVIMRRPPRFEVGAIDAKQFEFVERPIDWNRVRDGMDMAFDELMPWKPRPVRVLPTDPDSCGSQRAKPLAVKPAKKRPAHAHLIDAANAHRRALKKDR